MYARDYAENKPRYDSEPINAAALIDLLDELPENTLHGYQELMTVLVNTVS